MNQIIFKGIDGNNPLGFMAALGVLRAVTIADNAAAMGWDFQEVHPHPRLQTSLDSSGVTQALIAEADYAKTVITGIRQLSGNIDHIGAIPANEYRGLVNTVSRESLQKGIIPGMPSGTDYYAAFTCDALRDQKNQLPPSSLSFSNKGGNQFLFKDYLNLFAALIPDKVKRFSQEPGDSSGKRRKKSNASACNSLPTGADLMSENLIGNIGICCEMTNLNWDPAALREYALRWNNPEKEKKTTNIPLYIAGFLGFASMTSVPVGKDLRTLGISGDGKRFIWLIWEKFIGYAEIISILAGNGTGCQILECRRFSSNHRFYFSPVRRLR